MVTIPTIDQISGTTVMNKMRSLINAFINFANEVDTALTVTIPEYVDDALASYYTQTEINDMLNNYYTKSEVYTKTDVYTKSEVNNLLNDVLSHYYTQTQTNTLLSGKADTFILHEPLFFDTDLQDNKYIYVKRGSGITVDQLDGGKLISNIDGDTIQFDSDGKMYCTVEGATYTAGDGIDITDDIISLDGFELTTADSLVNDWNNNFLGEHDNEYLFVTANRGTFLFNKYLCYDNQWNKDYVVALIELTGRYDGSFNVTGVSSYSKSNKEIYIMAVTDDVTTHSLKNVKAYDGNTVIDSTNVSQYIDSVSGKCIKNFCFSFTTDNNVRILSSNMVLIGMDYIQAEIGSYNTTLKVSNLTNAITSSTTISATYSGFNRKDITITNSNITYYKRKSALKI